MITTADIQAAIKREYEKRGRKYIHTELRETLGGHTGLLAIGRFGPLRSAPPPQPPASDFKDTGANI